MLGLRAVFSILWSFSACFLCRKRCICVLTSLISSSPFKSFDPVRSFCVLSQQSSASDAGRRSREKTTKLSRSAMQISPGSAFSSARLPRSASIEMTECVGISPASAEHAARGSGAAATLTPAADPRVSVSMGPPAPRPRGTLRVLVYVC
jgi:hypothetical protein